MKRFDCLSPSSPIDRPCLLEASAGTGKTFAVEHIVVRLLIEQTLELEQILVITFTRAATRELKQRIRSNLEKAIQQLQSGQVKWAYLQALENRKGALNLLQDALASFDSNQIFTIHGFCHRMLKEFGFEAGCLISTQRGNPQIQTPKKLLLGVREFLLTLSEKILCPEQMEVLLKKHRSIESLIDKLLQAPAQKELPAPPFEALYQRYAAAWKSWDLPRALEDFQELKQRCKARIKGRFEEQIRALLAPPAPHHFQLLLAEKGSLFAFLSPENRKVRSETLSLPSQPFFEGALETIYPLIQEGINPKNIFSLLAQEWRLCAKRLMEKEPLLDPDQILQTMHEKMENGSFVRLVQDKYGAAVIDEFQDTDSLQWDIFRTLFFTSQKPVFLVGDPKQSIYRFRNADIYTYLEAKSHLPPAHHYCLDTNFRASPALISALNALFSRDWLSLPKLGSFLPYLPVASGVQDAAPLHDGKGALHFFLRPEPEEALWSCMAREILQLQTEVASLHDIAILVKDRYQASAIVRYLGEKGIPALAKSHTPLGETPAFQAWYEFLFALIDLEKSQVRAVLAGPLGRVPFSEIPPELPQIFFVLKEALETHGFARFIRHLLSATLHRQTVLEAIAAEDASFYIDFFHTVELLVQWERAEGFSLEGLQRTLKTLALSNTGEDEQVRRRSIDDEKSVQVLTIHVSKGLEFDIVFAVGLAESSSKEEEDRELDAEKLRQLYVAMTRAKRRLYVPLPASETKSPIALFFEPIKGDQPIEAALQKISEQASITWEVVKPQEISPLVNQETREMQPWLLTRYEVQPRYLHSFTSLATPSPASLPPLSEQGGLSLHTLPRGAEIGVLLHELLEDLFSAPYPLWQNPEAMREMVARKMKGTRFSDWTEIVQNMIERLVSLPFLVDLQPEDVRTEVEFLFEDSPHFIKGFIDLLFRKENTLYLVDWKSNWLGEGDDAYTQAALEQSMKEHEYPLQATLYAEALLRAFPQYTFGGAYYVFLRGIYSPTQGVFFFQPRRKDDLLA